MSVSNGSAASWPRRVPGVGIRLASVRASVANARLLRRDPTSETPGRGYSRRLKSRVPLLAPREGFIACPAFRVSAEAVSADLRSVGVHDAGRIDHRRAGVDSDRNSQ